ncbi:MAG: hypothetical protein QW046_04235 [Candidatus Micrarchaeaceae archaeon]
MGDIRDDEFKRLLEQNAKKQNTIKGNTSNNTSNKDNSESVIESEDKNTKPERRIRDQLSLDPKIYELYDYYKKEMDYQGDFSQFIVDMILNNARSNGIDIQIVKSASKGKFVQGIPAKNGNDGVPDDEDYEAAMRLLGVDTANPKQAAFQQLLEERKIALEERRLKMEDMRLNIESKQLDLEKKRLENERMRNSLNIPQVNLTNDGSSVSPNTSNSQKDREFELMKMMNDNNMKFMQLIASAKDNGFNSDFIKYLMDQNQKINDTIVALQNNWNEQKIRELENAIYAQNSDQQLERLHKQFEMIKDISGGFGHQKSLEEIKMEHELKLKQLEMEHQRQKEERDDARAENLTRAIRDTIGQFTESIGKPMGEALAEQARQKLAEAARKQKNNNTTATNNIANNTTNNVTTNTEQQVPQNNNPAVVPENTQQQQQQEEQQEQQQTTENIPLP